ncbi:MAG: hypothetical protein OEZ59_11010 [Deltaproteobacteria bacterium]|nr:hypothetical protein [Deltaproteobacteria bacterium]
MREHSWKKTTIWRFAEGFKGLTGFKVLGAWRFLPALLLAVWVITAHPGASRGQGQPGVPGQQGQPGQPGAPGAAPAPGQQFGAAPEQAPQAMPFDFKNMKVRLHIIALDQFAFKHHPFYQITGDGGYKKGQPAASSSFNLSRSTTSEEGLGEKIIHSLPTFGLEGVIGTGLPFPKGFAITVDWAPFNLIDVNAGAEGSAVTPLEMDMYMLFGGFKFFAFDPTQPGLNYYLGVSPGRLEGRLLYPDMWVGAEYYEQEVVSFNQSKPLGTIRLGLDSKGKNFGFRYELISVQGKEVKLSKPYPGQSNTKLDFSGTIIRLSFFYEFN